MVISYAISAVMAFLSALTFVEMAVDYPLAGSSFNYTLAVRHHPSPCPCWSHFAEDTCRRFVAWSCWCLPMSTWLNDMLQWY